MRCCFVGHRFEWHCVGVESKLTATIESLINQGFNIFFDGGYGYFDEICRNTVIKLKNKYPHIKLIKVLAFYNYKNTNSIPSFFEETIFPDIENVYYKNRISKRNEWLVENSDVVVCHIVNEENSGAYNTIKYAKKLNKNIIYI